MHTISASQAEWAANEFINYYEQFNTIEDYYRLIKGERILSYTASLWGPEDDIFHKFDMSPEDMEFSIEVIEDKPSRWTNNNFTELLHYTTSNPIQDSIPGRCIKWLVVEKNTQTVVGMLRFGSPTSRSKPRNQHFEKVWDMKDINDNFVMGFNIVPTQPFGYNYLGGKLVCLLGCSTLLKEQWDEKYGTDIKYFETTSLYGSTKGVSMYDGLKPYLRYIGDSESDLVPLLHDDKFLTMFRWFNDKVGEPIVPLDASGRKLKASQKMIAIIKRCLPKDKVESFNNCITHAKSLTQKKRTYLGDFRHSVDDAITWWKKKATKRYEKLKSEGRLRTQVEIWDGKQNIEIIR